MNEIASVGIQLHLVKQDIYNHLVIHQEDIRRTVEESLNRVLLDFDLDAEIRDQVQLCLEDSVTEAIKSYFLQDGYKIIKRTVFEALNKKE